jgi:hypothetical protein
MKIIKDINQLPSFGKSVITIGSFDGVHRGHQKILKRVISLAKEIEVPSVVLTFYPHPRKIIDPETSGVKLLNTIDEKIDILDEIGIDYLIIIPFSFEFSRMLPREYIENFLIKYFSPSYVVIGYDHRFGLNRGGDIHLLKEYSESYGYEVIEIPKQEIEEITVSSTEIRNALENGRIAEANHFLGYPYILSGKVVHGDKFGGKLGYPTANIQIPEKEKLVPKNGLYIAEISVDDISFQGVLYIGNRPTIGDRLATVAEVHIFDFDQNIYDKYIKVRLRQYLREDLKLESMDALKHQMTIDVKNTRDWFQENSKILLSSVEEVRTTIAILNFNGVEMLESYLPMIEYSSSRNDVEVMVIDNHSEDDSIEYLENWHPEIKLLPLSKNYGFAEGYNRGVEMINTEYVVFLNSDVLVTENWLNPIIEMMDADPSIAAVQPTILSLEDKNYYEYAGAAGGYIDVLGYPFCRGRIFDTVEKIQENYGTNAEIFWASGAAMVMRTSVFKGLGGFDKSFFAHQEEIDLCWRAKKAGYKIMVCAESKVYHLGGGTLNYGNSSKVLYNFRNNLFMLTKNETFLNLLWILPLKLILDGIAGIKFLLSNNVKGLVAVFRAHVEYYANLPTVIENSTRDSKLIQKMSIGPQNNYGKYFDSIVFQYYVKGRKTFNDLNPF